MFDTQPFLANDAFYVMKIFLLEISGKLCHKTMHPFLEKVSFAKLCIKHNQVYEEIKIRGRSFKTHADPNHSPYENKNSHLEKKFRKYGGGWRRPQLILKCTKPVEGRCWPVGTEIKASPMCTLTSKEN